MSGDGAGRSPFGPASTPSTSARPKATASGAITLTPTRVYEYYWTAYKRTWRASIASQFLNPVLFLLAMGVGLGSLVSKGHTAGAQGSLPHGVTYVAFLAPGLLAASAMQTAAMECTYPVMAAVKWLKTYFGVIATPVAVVGIVVGHLAWVATRLAMVATIFLAVMACFGTIHSPLAVLALPAAMLCGLAFAAPIAAFAATRENEAGFSALFRFGIVPMFLFSGVFFPVSQLPVGLRPVAWITPLWHGVDLCRSLTLGTAGTAVSIGHVAYLTAWALVGAAIAVRTHRKRLIV